MKKIKHDHKGTKLLKLGIFASIMLAPLFAIAFKCAYVTFNKNAKDSYYGETINQQEQIQVQYNEMEVNKKYVFQITEYITPVDASQRVDLQVENVIDRNGTYDLSNVNKLEFFMYPTTNASQAVLYCMNGSTTIRQFQMTSTFVNIEFDFKSYINNNNNLQYFNHFYEIEYNNYSYLDNAFYYAVDEIKNNELFNWTTNTALYTPTAAMTNGMGITTNTLPILITYWLYLTAIYIVIDIVVELFTALTHMITSRFEQ